MKRAFTMTVVLIIIFSTLSVPIRAIESSGIKTVYLQGKKGHSEISYTPMTYQSCKGPLLIQGDGFEHDVSGVTPVITVKSQSQIAFSYDASNIHNMYDDPTTTVLDIKLGASVRSGAIIVQKRRELDDGFDTVSVAVDVFKESSASTLSFYTPSYEDMQNASTFRFIIAYAIATENQTKVKRVVEIFEVVLQINSIGVSFAENLPEYVVASDIGDLNATEMLELYKMGGTLANGSVTPYGFTVNCHNKTTAVQVSYNNSAYRPVADGEVFTKQGQYIFRCRSCNGEVDERTIYITPPKDAFIKSYFPNSSIILGERLFNIESDIPVWALNSSIPIAKKEGLPPIYATLVNLDNGEEQAATVGTLHLNKPGRYLLILQNAPDNTPGTRCCLQYMFCVASPSDPYTTLNLSNLRESHELYAYKAQHWEVDVTIENQLVHIIFASKHSADLVANQYGTVAVLRSFDYSCPKIYDYSRYGDPNFQEVYVFVNFIERELCRSYTQLLPGYFVYVPCETIEVRAVSYSSGENKLIHFGIPVGEQIAEGRWKIIEILSSGRRVEYDVFYSDNVNRISYSLQYSGKSYTVSGERLHCVNSEDSVIISDILSRYDSEGIMKIRSENETIVLPIAQTTEIILSSGLYNIQFVSRMGEIVELEVNTGIKNISEFKFESVSLQDSVCKSSDIRTVYPMANTPMAIGLAIGVGACVVAVIIYLKRRREKIK